MLCGVNWKLYALVAALWLTAMATCVYVWQRKKDRAFCSLADFQHLPHVPILGSLYLVIGNMRVRVQKSLKLMTIYAANNSPMVFWFFNVPVVFLSTSEQIQMVSNKIQDRYVFGIFENILRDGILLARGEKWKNIRRIMNPAFSGTMLHRYMSVFNEQAIILSKRLSQQANTATVIDLWEYISDMNFDTVTENMTDYKLHVQETGGNDFSKAVQKALHLESQRINNPILFFSIFFTVFQYITGNGGLSEKINELPAQIVRQKMCEYENEKKKLKDNGVKEEKPEKSLIDFLLKIHETYPEFDENRIRIEILNMIFAGSDTTATTVSLVLLFLGIHPKIQDKVYNEILEVFQDDGRSNYNDTDELGKELGLHVNVNVHQCAKLAYMEQCIKETLRLFTLVPITARKCPEPVKIDDKLTIPANCMISFAYHAVHHNPIVYPNPERFDPDRFAPNNIRNKKDFMGFGAGPRACIGSKYAMLSMKTQLTHILLRYRLTCEMAISDIVHIVDMLSRSQNGYPVKIWRRSNVKSSVHLCRPNE